MKRLIIVESVEKNLVAHPIYGQWWNVKTDTLPPSPGGEESGVIFVASPRAPATGFVFVEPLFIGNNYWRLADEQLEETTDHS